MTCGTCEHEHVRNGQPCSGCTHGRWWEKKKIVLTTRYCMYPECECPFDAPADPNWCARGYPHERIRAALNGG